MKHLQLLAEKYPNLSPILQNFESGYLWAGLAALHQEPDSPAKFECLGECYLELHLVEAAKSCLAKAGSDYAQERLKTLEGDASWFLEPVELDPLRELPPVGEHYLFHVTSQITPEKPTIDEVRLIFKDDLNDFTFNYRRHRGYLYVFLQESDIYVRFSEADVEAKKPGAIQEQKRIAQLKQEMMGKYPDHAWCLLPKEIEFRLKWPEKPFAERDGDYLRETVRMFSGEFYPGFNCTWKLPFSEVQFTKEGEEWLGHMPYMIPYSVMNEHVYRMYGAKEYAEGEWEGGLWIRVKEKENGPAEIRIKMVRGVEEGYGKVKQKSGMEFMVEDEKVIRFVTGRGSFRDVFVRITDYFRPFLVENYAWEKLNNE